MSHPDPHGAGAVVEALGLRPHPEGGWYREVHRSAVDVHREDGATRSALTVIWFLVEAPEISRWHRVLRADETWHHAGGDPVELWLLPPEGGQAERRVLAPAPLEPPPATRTQTALAELLKERSPLQVVPAGWWQAARCLGRWSLVNCCVGPGFAFEDFQLLHDQPPDSHPPGALDDLL